MSVQTVALPADGPQTLDLAVENRGSTSSILEKLSMGRNIDRLDTRPFRLASTPAYHSHHVRQALAKIRGLPGEGGRMGREIVNLAEIRRLKIVCFPMAPGQFLSPEEDDRVAEPYIIWDPYEDFNYYGQIDQAGTHFRRCVMPSWLVLAHELGHHKQWFLARDQFTQWLRNHQIIELEMDNLRQHEWPITRSINQPVRKHYMHAQTFTNTTDNFQRDRVRVTDEWRLRADLPRMSIPLERIFTAQIQPLLLRSQQDMTRVQGQKNDSLLISLVKVSAAKFGAMWPRYAGPEVVPILDRVGRIRVDVPPERNDGNAEYVCENPREYWVAYRHNAGID